MVLGLGSRKRGKPDESDVVTVPLPVLVAGTFYVQVAPLNSYGQWVGASVSGFYRLFEGADKWELELHQSGSFLEIVGTLP